MAKPVYVIYEQQPVQPLIIINTFVVHCQDSIKKIVAIFVTPRFELASASLSLPWSHISVDVIFMTWLLYKVAENLTVMSFRCVAMRKFLYVTLLSSHYTGLHRYHFVSLYCALSKVRKTSTLLQHNIQFEM